MIVREALPADIPRIVGLSTRFIYESNYCHHIVPDKDMIAGLAERLIKAPNGMILVADDGADIFGLIGVIATVHPLSGEDVVSELIWYVDPEKRGIGLRLLKAVEAWARENEIMKLIMIAPDARVEKFYERAGFSRLETQYIKRL